MHRFLVYLRQWHVHILNEFNATEEDLASVAVKNHENGILNPKAHLRKKITVDDVMNSAVVASPLKLYDCCPFSDGASSVILCNEKFAKEHSKDYVKVIGSGRGGSPASLQGREHLTTIPSTKDCGRSCIQDGRNYFKRC